MTKVSDILRPKSTEEISSDLNKLDPVERFCAEFWFHYQKLIVRNLKTINFIIDGISNKEKVSYTISNSSKFIKKIHVTYLNNPMIGKQMNILVSDENWDPK